MGYGVDEFMTGTSERATVRFRDGTVVRLAPETHLRLTGGSSDRELSIEGRAYFAVAHQRNSPFRIRTRAGQMTVLGTRFDVRSEGDHLQLVVVEGQVALAAGDDVTEVRAGESMEVIGGTALPVRRVADIGSLVAWTGDFLAFQNTPLRDAVREIERQYHVRIEVTDAELLQRTLTTWFTDKSLDDVMKVVCIVVNAQCTQGGRGIRMLPR